jgi:hypothetical protein
MLMIKACRNCAMDFTVKGAQAYCSELCRRAGVKAVNNRTQKKRRANGKAREYAKKRRNSAAGYLDRFMERISDNTPDSDITREWLQTLIADDVCNLTGIPFKYLKGEGVTSFQNPYAPSVDRIDSAKGYYKDNVQMVLVAINLGKSQMTMKEFTDVWVDIAKSWEALNG